MTDKLMCGIDLHSNNLFCGIVDTTGKRIFEKKLPCDLPKVLNALQPFQSRLDTIAVESTFNWYWLLDGLEDHGYRTVLANPAGMQQYSGLKHSDDKSDAFFLAEQLRLKILPTGHVCDRRWRPIRDLLRRRLGLVRKQTSLILSLKSLHIRTHGEPLSLGRLKQLTADETASLFVHPADQLVARTHRQLMMQLHQTIEEIEKVILKEVKPLPQYQALQTLPGIGVVLALTIFLETGDVKRFADAGNYASYCRCVKSLRLSNNKKKGQNNGKCGNKYLAWAYVEAANFAKRYHEECRRFFDRKAARTNNIVATKALACKLAKGAWHVMSEGGRYDPERMFPNKKYLLFGENGG
jgi:transposase